MSAMWAVLSRYAVDILAIAGVLLVAVGLGLYSAPLAPIVLGLGLVATARFGSR